MEERAYFKHLATDYSNSKKPLLISSAVFMSIAGMMVFEDYLESQRTGHSFYFGESFLFKTILFLFIPILTVLYSQLKRHDLTNPYTTAFFVIVPIFFHYLTLPLVFLTFSFLFYGGRYDLYKILSYTLANDLTVLVFVYSSFVLGYKYFSAHTASKVSTQEKKPTTLVVNNGKNNSIIATPEIVQIVAATPYVTIQTQNKKYLHTTSLKSIQELLDKKEFLRVHKSTIVNIRQVSSFKSRLNGDYDLHLKNGEQVRMSRTYAANFKNALANQVTS